MDRLVACWLLIVSVGGIAVPQRSPADERPLMHQAEVLPPEPAGPSADPRIPVPSADARRTSTARVKEIYADDYAAARPPARKAEFAKRLVEQAAATADHADRWALLTEALRLATDAGDTTTALPLIDRFPTEFAVERNGSRLEALTRLATKASGQAADEVASACLEVARDADKGGEEEIVAKAVTLASGIARKTKNAGLLADATRLQQKAKERQKVAKELEPLLKKVQASPADPDANLEAGRALCLKADRWTEGLPLLAKGSDAGLARAAAAEAAGPKVPSDLIRLADAWWDWADSQKPPWKLPAQTHAAVLYGRVVNELQGLDKARVEKRITNMSAASGGTGETLPLAAVPSVEVVGAENGMSKDGTFNGKPFTCRGKKHPSSIFTHPTDNATATIAFRLPAGVRRLRGAAGVFSLTDTPPTQQPGSPIVMRILADGEVLWTSPQLTQRDQSVPFDVELRGCTKLELHTTSQGSANTSWGAWLDPLLVQ